MSGQNGQDFVDQNRNIEAKGLDAARNLRLIERAGLLLEERQIVLRVKDELTTAIEARMPGDLARAADDRDLVDEALDQDVAKTKAVGAE